MTHAAPVQADQVRVPFLATAVAAYRRAWADRRGLWPLLPPVLLLGVSISLAMPWVEGKLLWSLARPTYDSEGATFPVLWYVISFAVEVPIWILSVMYAVAIHRRVLLGEAAGWALLRWSRRHTAFAGLSVLLASPWSIAAALGLAVPMEGIAVWGLMGALLLLSACLMARLSVAFPAISTGRYLGLAATWRSTRGNGWRIVLVSVCVYTPLIVVAFIEALFGVGETTAAEVTQLDRALDTAWNWTVVSLLTLVQVAAVSLIYRQVTGPAGAPRARNGDHAPGGPASGSTS